MSGQIRAVYDGDPGFPATDQHPNAVRHQVGQYFVDAVGGKPTQGEVDAFRRPAPEIPELDFGSDLPPEYGQQIPAAIEELRAYLSIAPGSVTPAQREAALRTLIRLVLFMARRTLR